MIDGSSFRLSPENMQMQTINVQKNTSSKFSFPPLPTHIVSPEEPVDVRVSVRMSEQYNRFHNLVVVLIKVCFIEVFSLINYFAFEITYTVCNRILTLLLFLLDDEF